MGNRFALQQAPLHQVYLLDHQGVEVVQLLSPPARRQSSRATAGVSFVLAGRVISCKVFATSPSESTFKKGDCRKETLSAVFSVSSNTGSPVLLAKSARTMESFSVKRCVAWRERK